MAKKQQKQCSFCGRTEEEAGGLLEGINSYICPECIYRGHQLLEELSGAEAKASEEAAQKELKDLPKPREIKEFLDGYVVGQDELSAISRSPYTTTTSASLSQVPRRMA